MFVTLFLSSSPLALNIFLYIPSLSIQLEYVHIQMDFVNFMIPHFLRTKSKTIKLSEHTDTHKHVYKLRYVCVRCNLCHLFAINRNFNFISVLQFYRKVHWNANIDLSWNATFVRWMCESERVCSWNYDGVRLNCN